MLKRNKWALLFLLLLALSSCGFFKQRIVTKTDSIFVDKTIVVKEREVDTIITIKSDTVSYSFTQPKKDTIFTLTDKGGSKVRVEFKNERYYLLSISGKKQVPIKIKEKVTEYKNVYIRQKSKDIVKKSNPSKFIFIFFAIIWVIVLIFIYKDKLFKK